MRTHNEFPDLSFEEVYGDLDTAAADAEEAFGAPEEAGRNADAADGDAAEFPALGRRMGGPRSIVSRRGMGVVAVAVVAMAISALVVHAVRSQLSGGAGGLPAADLPTTISRPPASAPAPPGGSAPTKVVAKGVAATVATETTTKTATPPSEAVATAPVATARTTTEPVATSAGGDHDAAAGTSSAIPEFGFER